MVGQGALAGDGRGQCIRGALEDDEEGVALGAELVTAVCLEHGAEEATLSGEQIGIAVAQLPEKASGAFDVGKEKGDGALGQRSKGIQGGAFRYGYPRFKVPE
jgi:hypothetical protein